MIYVPAALTAHGSGRVGLSTDVSITAFLLVLLYIISPPLQLSSVLVVMSAKLVLMLIAKQWQLAQIMHINRRKMMLDFLKIACATVAMGWVSHQLMLAIEGKLTAAISAVLIGSATYLLVYSLVNRQWFNELRAFLSENN